MVIMSHPLDTTLGPMAPFVCQLLTEMHALMGECDAPVVDHLCYRAATLPEYLALKETLARHGVLLVEGMIGGRPIATYRLHQPVAPHRLVDVHRVHRGAVESGQPHVPHDHQL